MKHLFLDCGGNNGCSVRLFRNKYPAAELFEIHSFEPNPKLAVHFEGLNVHFHPTAVWTYDGVLKFYLGGGRRASGSSVFKHKKTGKVSKTPLEVPCVDFARFLKEHATHDAYVVLKLDIEGAEYAVLDHLIKQNLLCLIDELFVEWHYDRIDHPVEDHNRIQIALSAANLVPKEWDGEADYFEGMRDG